MEEKIKTTVFNYGAIYWNQIPGSKRLAKDYAKKEIEIAKRCSCKHIFFFVDFDGLMIYPSKYIPQVKRLVGRDLLAELVDEAHRSKLSFTACWMGMHVQTYLAKEHPDWWFVKLDNNKLVPEKILCINSPHRNILLGQFEEVIKKYGVDGIYQDGLYFPEYYCFCKYCKEKYKNMFGKDMPLEILDENRTKLREESLVSYTKEVREVINKTNPKVLFFLDCHGSIIGTVDSREIIYKTCEFVDSYILECYYEVIKEQPYYVGMETQLVKAETDRMIVVPKWIAKSPDFDYVSVSDVGIKLWAIQSVMNQALPLFINQNVTMYDEKTIEIARNVFKDIEKLRKFLEDAKRIKYAALVHSIDTKLKTLPYKPREHRQYFEGFYQALLSTQIPFDVLSEKDILKGELKNYRTIILPNVRCMSEEVAKIIEEHVNSGGGLVMTYKTSLEDENCNERKDFRLGEIAGIKFKNMQSTRKKYNISLTNYYRVAKQHFISKSLEAMTFSFNANIDYAGVELLPGTEAILKLTGYDEELIKSGNYFVSYPTEKQEDPILVVKEGKGRVVSILAPLDRVFWEYGWTELYDFLSRSVVWSARVNPSIEINCPKTIHSAIFEKDNIITILLINYTINQMYSIGFPGSFVSKTEELTRGWPVQYCVPINDIKILIKTDKRIKKIFTLTGEKIKFNKERRKILINLPKINEYEAIIVEFSK